MTKLTFTPEHDARILAAYCGGQLRRSSPVKILAADIGCSQASIHRRAVHLGVSIASIKHKARWSAEELRIFEDNAHLDYPEINKKLLKAGYPERTILAFRHIAKRNNIKLREHRTACGIFTFTDLSRTFGVDRKTISNWANKHGLPHKVRKSSAQTEYIVKSKHLREWVIENVDMINLGYVDKHQFVEIMVGYI